MTRHHVWNRSSLRALRPLRSLIVAAALLVATSAPARADITAFLGANTTPANRQVRGAALGIGLLVVAFEVEYAYTPDDLTATAPSLKTGMGNVILQTPVAFMGFQPYFTTGGGLYQEELGTHSDTGVGFNTGGGVKVSLAGPIRLRVDYRVFKLGSGALNSPAHRFYAGLNLKL
jgi:opacity protein-like surface antigen